MACNSKKIEVNQVAYPGTPDCPVFDSIQNWPATTEVTQSSGEDITRNRDALLILERILGLNPHIGLFTIDPRTATVSQRISILEQGISEGRFELKTLKVERAIETIKDVHDRMTLLLGLEKNADYEATEVKFRGPIRIADSGARDPRAQFEVGFAIKKSVESQSSTDCLIEGSSLRRKPLLHIKDFNQTEISNQDHLALLLDGNLHVNGFITGNFAIDHNRLNNINTDPVIDAQGVVIQEAIHVSRGNFHSHKRGEYNPTLGRWLIDPNPVEPTYGLVNHLDLEPESTRTSIRQQNFIPDPNVAYHVTNGDDHNHVGGAGAPIRHRFLLGIDPKNSNHVTNGDFHKHDPALGDGASIPTNGIILQETLEQALLSINEFEPEADLSTVLIAINACLEQIDLLNEEHGERIEQNESDIEELREDFRELDTKAASLRSEVTTLAGDLVKTKDDVRDQSKDIEKLKARQISAAIFGVTVTNLGVNEGLFGIGGAPGQSADTYETALEASTLIPRKGILKNLVVRSTGFLPEGVLVPVTVWINGQPTPLVLTLVGPPEADGDVEPDYIPDPLIDNISQFPVEVGDLITFGYFNQGTAAVEEVSIAAAILLVAVEEDNE